MATRRRSTSSKPSTAKTGKGKRKIPIDWDKAKGTGGGGVRIKPGTYKVRIVKAVFARSSKAQTPGIKWTFQILDGKNKGKKIEEWTYLTDKSVFRVRLITEALGLKVPKAKGDIDLDKYERGELYIEVADDKDETGKYATKSRVTQSGFISVDEFESDETDEDEDEEEDDDEDFDDEDDDEEEDEEEDEEDDDEDEDDDDEDEDLDDM